MTFYARTERQDPPDLDQKRHERRGHRELKEHLCQQENRGAAGQDLGSAGSRSKWPKLIGSLPPSTLTRHSDPKGRQMDRS
jgi:hypothetical protein